MFLTSVGGHIGNLIQRNGLRDFLVNACRKKKKKGTESKADEQTRSTHMDMEQVSLTNLSSVIHNVLIVKQATIAASDRDH